MPHIKIVRQPQRPNTGTQGIFVALSRKVEAIMRGLAMFSVLALVGAASASAQTTPSPGPTNPSVPNPQAKPGATIIINPTEDECRRGWSAGMRWTKEQFTEYCTRLGASK